MLPQDFKDSILSLNETELEALYIQFIDKNNTNDVIEFARYLYINDHVTSDELKRLQNQEKVDLTKVVDVWGNGEKPGQQHAEEDSARGVYTILESIDEGAMGEILIAKDNILGRTVAYKIIHPHVAEYPNFLKRFFMEAQITAQLQHPNIVPVYGLVSSDKGAGYAMKLIHGKTLKDLLEGAKEQIDKNKKTDEQHSLAALLDHFLKVCDALHYAHRKGVVHRDLKPLNIMVGPYNEVYVMDWGIAKLVEVNKDMFEDATQRIDPDEHREDEDKTTIGEMLGTPLYMSPEQARGAHDTLDHRSDIFTLGLILYELLTLKRALGGKTQLETIERANSARINPPVPYSRNLDVPQQLVAIVKKATRLKPDDRYTTVQEFADDIRRYLRGEAVSARPDTTRHKIIRWMNRHRVATLNVVTYSILASIIIVSWSLYQQQQSKIETQLHTEKISRFLSAAAAQSQVIDSQFLKFEGILEGVASAAISLLEQGNPDPGRFYDYKDLDDPQRAPPDYAYSPVYGFPISTGWHAYKLAPGVAMADVESLVRTLNPLRHAFKRMILKSHDTVIAPNDNETANRVIRDEGLPLVWIYVSLEEGIHAVFPGKAGYPPEYDARKRPWYVNTLENDGACWMPPYIDIGGRGVLLPCTSKLFNNKGGFLGIAAVEMTLEYIRHELMSIPDISGVESTYLLSDRGVIMVDSSETSRSYKPGTLINTIDNLEIYPRKKVVDNILQGKSGHIDYSENGREKTLAFYRLNAIGWYYLAEADAGSLALTPDVTAP